jgi:enamine deaminase RidA (YjgF/YER057c/UK114 family)
MVVEYMNPVGLHAPVDNMYSHVATGLGGTLIRIGGQVAVDAEGANVAVGDMPGQIRVCYEMTSQALASVGASWHDVVHVYTFTTDIDSYIAHEQAIVRQYFGQTPPPSTVVQVPRLVDPAWLVEVQVDAVSDGVAGTASS